MLITHTGTFRVQDICPSITLSARVVETTVTPSQVVHVKATITGGSGSGGGAKKNKKKAGGGSANTISLAIIYDDNVLYFPQPSVKPSLAKSYPKPIFYDPDGEVNSSPTTGTMYWKSIPIPAQGRSTVATVVGMVDKDVIADELEFEIVAFKGTLDSQTCVISQTATVSGNLMSVRHVSSTTSLTLLLALCAAPSGGCQRLRKMTAFCS